MGSEASLSSCRSEPVAHSSGQVELFEEVEHPWLGGEWAQHEGLNRQEEDRENARLVEEDEKEPAPVRRRQGMREHIQMEEIKYEELPR